MAEENCDTNAKLESSSRAVPLSESPALTQAESESPALTQAESESPALTQAESENLAQMWKEFDDLGLVEDEKNKETAARESEVLVDYRTNHKISITDYNAIGKRWTILFGKRATLTIDPAPPVLTKDKTDLPDLDEEAVFFAERASKGNLEPPVYVPQFLAILAEMRDALKHVHSGLDDKTLSQPEWVKIFNDMDKALCKHEGLALQFT